MAHNGLRSTGKAIVVSTVLVVGSSRLLWAAPIDCETINAASAAGVLGVPKAKSNPSQGHHKQPPDNMDVFACGYVEVSPDPLATAEPYVGSIAIGGGVITYAVRGKQLVAAATGMQSPTWPVKAQSARIVVYGLR